MDKFFNFCRKHGYLMLSSNIENKKQKYKKYEDSYLNFGFTSIVVGKKEYPQCITFF